MGCIQINQLSFTYPEDTEPALQDVSLTIPDGAFFVLCGLSGCGKSTLLRQLKPALAPHGTGSGSIYYNGVRIDKLDLRQQSQKIGFVQQNPEYQIVTDKVWHELAFGMESLGYDTGTIRRRVAEMASFFGIQTWFHKSTAELSGGQKQLLNLAAVMVLQPDVLILDEPASQLDPIAASEFLELLGRINRELGTTIVLSEHRLEEALTFATKAAVLDNGRVLAEGSVPDIGAFLRNTRHAMYQAMPCAMQVWAALASQTVSEECPVSVREGNLWLNRYAARHPANACIVHEKPLTDETAEPVIRAKGAWYRYERNDTDVVKGFDFTARKGDRICILGGNGTGKTTALKLLAGLYAPYRGSVTHTGTVMLLPQNPQTMFLKSTVRADLLAALPRQEQKEEAILETARLCGIANLLSRHPYDLSGGEQQRAALAKLLLLQPDILLLDEPTKGFDIAFQQTFASILDALQQRGITVIMVSHDVEFCARYGQQCMLFFDGAVIVSEPARTFFAGNHFYTTAASRIARNILPEAITAEDIILSFEGSDSSRMPYPLTPPENKADTDTRQRKEQTGQTKKEESRGGGSCRIEHTDEQKDKRPTGNKTVWSSRLCRLLPLVCIPLTLLLGMQYLPGNRQYITALLVMAEAMLPFLAAFENRKPHARELVLLAVICAIAVAGRAAFFMLPQCKPVLAIIILTGAVLGAETGFLAGVITMLASNMLFGQGIWTPWQMFAMGLCGYLAGVLFQKGRLPHSRFSLGLFGLICAIGIYGVIMNLSTALLYTPELTFRAIAPYLLSGYPMDCMHGAATWLFLWFGAEPVIEKLERIKEKHGIFGG